MYGLRIAYHHAAVLASLIQDLDEAMDDFDLPLESDWCGAMAFERDNLISRWQEMTGESWPERGP